MSRDRENTATNNPANDRVAGNTRQALALLRPQLWKFAYKLTACADEADELVQAAYERGLSRLHQWQPGTQLHSWMYRVIYSIYVNKIQYEKLRQGQGDKFGSDNQLPATMQDDNEVELEYKRLIQALRKIPAAQRNALILVAVKGFTYDEAARLLGVPVGTVRSRVFRARSVLLSLWQDRS